MMMKIAYRLLGVTFLFEGALTAHCQMPCGIYHDDIVFDEIDQYIETMYKGISVMNNSKFDDAKSRNEFVRWVIEKEKASGSVAEWITRYFLQQKIKPGEAETSQKLASAHKLLFSLVGIKQNSSVEFVEEFSREWDKFKSMFHREGYECLMEQMKLQKAAQDRQKLEIQEKGSAEKSVDSAK